MGDRVPRAVALIPAASTVRRFMLERSISMPPSRRWFPAQLCPPERTAILMSSSPAISTARTTSASPAARTISCG